MATIKVVNVVQKHNFTWYEKFYFYSIVKGMGITLKHFIKSAFLGKRVTLEYPEKKRQYSSRFRGMHSLKRDEQGRERCTSCFCCMWICPADAIYIEAAETTPEDQHLHPEERAYDRKSRWTDYRAKKLILKFTYNFKIISPIFYGAFLFLLLYL